MRLPLMLAARYLAVRKWRALLTTLAITLGVILIFGLNSLVPAFLGTLRQGISATAGQADLVVSRGASTAFDASTVQTVLDVDGVEAASGSLQRTLVLPGDGPFASLLVTGLDPETAQDVRVYPVSVGRFLEVGGDATLLLPAQAAENAGLAVGDELLLPSTGGAESFTIVGLVSTPPVPGSVQVLIPLESAQRLFNEPGRINTIEARLAPSVNATEVSKAAEARLGAGFTLGQPDPASALVESMNVGVIVLNMFGVLALALGAFFIFNTFRTVVAERRHDIGLLRAVGASRRTIILTLMTESALQGLIGTVLGILLGAGMAFLAVRGVATILKQYAGLEPGPPVFSPLILGVSVVVGVGVAVVGGLLPALSASRVTPLEALRPQVVEVKSGTTTRSTWVGLALLVVAIITLFAGSESMAILGALLFLLALLLLTPRLLEPVTSFFGRLYVVLFAREGSLAQANLSREPGRAAVTASAMTIALAVIVMLAGVVASITAGFLNYAESSLRSDFLVLPASLVLSSGNIGAGPELANSLRETSGVAEVSTVRLGMAALDGEAVQVLGVDPESYPAVSGLSFREGEPDDAYAALARERALIVNTLFASTFGGEVGETVALQTPEGVRDYRIVAVGTDYLNAKMPTGYISQGYLEQDFHQTNDLLLMINAAPGSDLGAVQASLEEALRAYPAFSLTDSGSWVAEQRQLLSAVMSVYSVMMVVLTLPALFALANTLAMTVLERTREIGVLRAIGALRAQIRRLILAESLLIAGTGVFFGLLAGVWLGWALVGAVRGSLYDLPYVFPTAGLIIATVIGLGFGIVAALMPARQAARLDIVAALRTE